jgi:hypothetical protein
MRWVLASSTVVLAACASSPPSAEAPVATVVLAPPTPASPEPPDAAAADAPPDSPPLTDAAVARAYATKPACKDAAMDLEAVQRQCACPLALEAVLADAAPPCALDPADEQRIVRDVAVHVTPPPGVTAGARTDLDVRIDNTGALPVPLVFVDDEHPELKLADSRGRPVAATVDPSCTPMATLRMAPVALVVVPPGGSVRTRIPFQAVRWRSVGPSWRPKGVKLTPLERALQQMGPSDPLAQCRDVPDGPLPRGDYTIEVRIPFIPQDLESKLAAHVPVQVQ